MFRQRIRRHYKVHKTVRIGDTFIEHYYQGFKSANLIGRWIKTGVTVNELNEKIVSKLVCEGCVLDAQIRRHNTVPAAKCGKEGLDGEEDISQHSYQVEGESVPIHCFDLNIGKCRGEDPSCWAWQKYEHLLDCARSGYKNKFTFRKIVNIGKCKHSIKEEEACNHDTAEEILLKMFMEIKPRYKLDNTYREMQGKACIRGTPPFFHPSFLKGLAPPNTEEVFYVGLSVRQSGVLPPEKKWIKSEIPARSWVCAAPYAVLLPATYEINFYLKNPLNNNFPQDESEMKKFHDHCAMTIIELYPGHSMFRVLQYKRVQKDQYPDLHESDYVDLDPFLSDPYIPQVRSGLAGPIVSYWSRIHENNAKY